MVDLKIVRFSLWFRDKYILTDLKLKSVYIDKLITAFIFDLEKLNST